MAVTWSIGTQTATITGDNGGSDIISAQTDISVSASDNSFNDASNGFSGLVEKDRILVKGFSNFENNGQFIVKSMTASKIIVYEDIITENAGNSITVRKRGNGYNTLDIVAAINNSTYAQCFLYPGQTSTTYPDILYNANSSGGSRILKLSCRILIADDSLWKDYSAIILHTWNNSTSAITFNNAYSTMELGYLNDLNQDKPITAYSELRVPSVVRTGCVYSFMSNNANPVLFGYTTGSVGILNIYGGMWKLRDDTVSGKVESIGENETYAINMPDRTSIIQVHFSNYGGANFPSVEGTRIQESSFKSSRNAGLNISGGVFRRKNKIQIVNSNIGLDFNNANNCDIYGVQFRGCTDDIRVRDINANQTVRIIDSDTIENVHTTMSFESGALLIEGTSFDISLLDGSGNGINDVRACIYRISNGIVYGSEVTSSGGGTGIKSTLEKLIGYRYGYDSTHTTIASRIVYGNSGIRIRIYGKKFFDASKVLGEKGITETIVLSDNNLISLSKSTVAAYTGIAINTTTEEITLTNTYTIGQLYQYLQYYQAESTNLDTEELLKSTDGITYTLSNGWDIIGLNYLNLSGAYITGKYVPIDFYGIVAGTKCAVIKYSDSSTLGAIVSTSTTASITVAYTSTTNVYGRMRLAGYLPYSSLFLLGTTGNIVYPSVITDNNYT